MKRTPVFYAACLSLPLALPALADGPWSVAVDWDGMAHEMSGSRNYIIEDAGTQNWGAMDAYVDGWTGSGLTCDTVDAFNVDFFFGDTWPGYEGHLIFELIPGGRADWRVDYPALFFSTIDAGGDAIATYEGFDSVQVLLTDVRCDGPDHLQITMDFKGNLLHPPSGHRTAVRGNATVQFPIVDSN